MPKALQQRTYEILEKGAEGDRASIAFDWFLIALICLNVLAVVLETVQSLQAAYAPWFARFEVLSVAIFSAEYMLRLWSCTQAEPYRSPLIGRIRFALTPMALVDLTAIAPFYLPMLIPLDLRFVRALRLLRLFRLLKVGRYSASMLLIGRVLRQKREELVITLGAVGILLLMASSVMFYVERDAQPAVFSSIPAAMWWGVATLTTVGYGDVYPITVLGKACAAVVAILGVATFALPAGIIASGFTDAMTERRADRRCPHCGGQLGME
jgi:voltage-gated potassium channel